MPETPPTMHPLDRLSADELRQRLVTVFGEKALP